MKTLNFRIKNLTIKFSRPERIKPIADRFDLDPNGVLENILYARAYNSEHQYELLNR